MAGYLGCWARHGVQRLVSSESGTPGLGMLLVSGAFCFAYVVKIKAVASGGVGCTLLVNDYAINWSGYAPIKLSRLTR